MAGRPKKVVTENTTVDNKVETTTKTNTVDNSAEMDSLRKENEELKSQLQMILEKLSTIEEKENTTVSENEAV